MITSQWIEIFYLFLSKHLSILNWKYSWNSSIFYRCMYHQKIFTLIKEIFLINKSNRINFVCFRKLQKIIHTMILCICRVCFIKSSAVLFMECFKKSASTFLSTPQSLATLAIHLLCIFFRQPTKRDWVTEFDKKKSD